jgi:hypothetical protein
MWLTAAHLGVSMLRPVQREIQGQRKDGRPRLRSLQNKFEPAKFKPDEGQSLGKQGSC